MNIKIHHVIAHQPRHSVLEILSSTEEEVEISSPFGGSIASDEEELAIDEDISGGTLVPSCHFVPDSNVVIREGEECVRRALEEIAPSDGLAEESSEGGSFVDIMCSLEKETGGESEGFTFADVLQRADVLSETVLEGVVDTLDLLLC